MSKIICKKCGKSIDTMNDTLAFCPFCGVKIFTTAEPETNTAKNLIGRMYMFLEDGDFQSAHMYAERILNIDLQYADAYLGKVMVSLRIRKKEDLVHSNPAFANSPDFKRAMEFADDALKQELLSYLESIHTNEMNQKFAFSLQCMQNAKTEQDFLKAAELFKPLSGFENADSLYETCLEKANETAFAQADQWMAESNAISLQKAIDILKRLPEKQDTDSKIALCEAKIAEIKQKTIKWVSIILPILVIALVSFFFWYFSKYEWTVTKETTTWSNGNQTIYEYQYNEDGLVEKETHTDSYGDQDFTQQYNYKYQYNKDGLVEIETRTNSDGDQFFTVYKYNKDGLVTNRSNGDQFFTEYKYNKDGLVTKETSTRSNGDQFFTVYKYNKDGLVEKETHTDSDGDQTIYEYKYNKDGLVEKETKTWSDGDQSFTVYKYNKDGLVEKETCTDSDSDQTIYEYQYNKAGLVEKETCTDSDGDQYFTEYEYALIYKKFGKEEK